MSLWLTLYNKVLVKVHSYTSSTFHFHRVVILYPDAVRVVTRLIGFLAGFHEIPIGGDIQQ